MSQPRLGVRPLLLILCTIHCLPAAAGEFPPRADRLVTLEAADGRIEAPDPIFGRIPRLASEFSQDFLLQPSELETQFRPNNDRFDAADLQFVAFPLGNLLGGNARFRGEYADDFDSNRRIGGHLFVFGRSWMGVETEFHHREFDLPGGRDNEFWTGDANLMFRMPEVRMINMRAGAGANWFHDQVRTDVGYNLTYSADVFIKQPWLLSGEVDWGRIGSRDLFHGRMTLGIVFGTFEVYTGYDYYDLGDLELDGLVGGAGIYF